MNREVKFRAWDGSQMIYRGLYDRNWYTDEKGGKVVRSINPNDINDLKVMQYTGLKDKNGREIYEGDYDSNFDVVFWCHKRVGWAWSIYDFPTKEYIACHCYNCEGDFEITDIIDDLEIIGNIYVF